MNTYAADKGYDHGNHHFYLEQCGLHSAICLKRTRTQKKDAHKDVWLALEQTSQYQQGLEQRYKIERKFGQAKQVHGFRRCRYLGKIGFAVQAFLTAIVLNLKRMVKLLWGIGFKTPAVSLNRG